MQHKKRDFDRNARVRKKYADDILPLQVGESVGDCAEKSVSLLGEALEEEKASFVGMAKEALFMTVYFLKNGSPFRLHQSAANSVR